MTFNELKWVEYLKRKVKAGPGVIRGIGDDCAQVTLGNKKMLLKSDLFIEDVHFTLNTVDLKTIGMRAVARVLSDFAACGGAPKYIGISLGRPKYINDTQLKMILSGVLAMSKKYNFSLIGGDTGRAHQLFLDVWGVGSTERFISRSGAKIGDYIFVSGKLGARKFTEAFQPRIKEAQHLVEHFKINAMIDISDGFALDMYRLAEESDKGVLLYQEKIPVTSGYDDIYRGEDYELIFTVDRSERKIEELKKRFYFIGVVTHKLLGYVVLHGNTILPLQVKGYTHF